MQNNMETTLKKMSEEIWNSLLKSGLPIHSFLMDWNGQLIKEAYQAPYEKEDYHRMFSITKSLTSIAIGFLLDDGRITLEDKITDYFPEYCLSGTAHPWLLDMTIRHMLTMETCHASTTYKRNRENHWVESFFITPPSHRSGQIFLYDTSASHTLAALVTKLTGYSLLDYLREKCLDGIGFSKEAYIMKDPFGSDMGGTGLMALPSDLIKLGRFCMDTIYKGQGIFANYLREAVSLQVPTLHFGQTLEEQLGYGYQFWRIRDGFAMYGLGGQYVLFYPEQNLVFAITADTQNIKGGNQTILNMIGDRVRKLESIKTDMGTLPYETEQKLSDNPLKEWNSSYRLLDNEKEFETLILSFNQSEGLLILSSVRNSFSIPFSFTELKVSTLQGYNERIAVKAVWADSHTLYLPVQIVGESVGSIHIMLSVSEKNITVFMRKAEESLFTEFQGFLEGMVI
jgi:CubicO group peptidase (beta-lactamase class C family)